MSFSLSDNANWANIYGGSINGAAIGNVSPTTGVFTTLVANTPASIDNSTNVATTAFVNALVPKSNSTSTSPGVSDDGTQGYAPGSVWYNTTTEVMFICLSSNTGAAVWLPFGIKQNPQYRSGVYVPTFGGTLITNVAVPGFGTSSIIFYPFYVPEKMAVASLNFKCVTGGTSSWIRAGIWKSSGGLPYGSALYAYLATDKATTSSGTITMTPGSTLTLDPGIYWIGIENGGSAAPQMQSMAANTDLTIAIMIGRPNISSNTGIGGLTYNNPGSGATAWTTGQSPTFTGSESWTGVYASGTPFAWLLLA